MLNKNPAGKPKLLGPPAQKLLFAAGMLVLGCVLPILAITSQTAVPAWKIGTLEVIGFGGLALLLGQLVVKIRLPLRTYAIASVLALLATGLLG